MARALSGVVLAAGRSRRMGRDKALLEVAGTPLWRRQRDVLAAAGAAEIFLSARPDQSWARNADGFAAVLHDAWPDCGPLVGITAAIERMTQPHLAVLAIDLPGMTADWLSDLHARCAPGVGWVARRGEHFEPLAAVFPRELKWLAWERLAAGKYAVQPLVTEAVAQGLLRVAELRPDQDALFVNWNEPLLPDPAPRGG